MSLLAAAGGNGRIKNAHQFRICGGLAFATRYDRPRRGQSEAVRETLTPYKGGAAAAGPIAAGGVNAVMMGARDVSPRGGGLLHTSTAPQRPRHCNIARAILLLCLLAAADGNNNAAIRRGCKDVGGGGGGPSWRCCFVFAIF